MNRAELKAQAKTQIAGKIGILFVITLIIGAISGAAGVILSFVPGGSLIASIIITPAFSLSMVRVYLMVIRGDNPEVAHAFCGFDDFFSAFKVTFLVGLYTFLWSLLFIIPGIIKSYSYSMAYYIKLDHPEYTPTEAITESRRLMDGNKMRLFCLHLSFIGWAIVCLFTLGIGTFWLIPYMNAANAEFYQDLVMGRDGVEAPFVEVN